MHIIELIKMKSFLLPSLENSIFRLYSKISVITFNSTKNNIFLKIPHIKNKKNGYCSLSHSNVKKDITFNSTKNYVFFKYPQYKTKKNEIFLVPNLKDCIFSLSIVNPEIIRKFRRVKNLKPEDVLKILVNFEPSCEKIEVEVKKVKSLWGLFNLVSENDKFFEHLVTSYKVMANMLVRVGLVKEFEELFSKMELKGIFLDSEILSNLVVGYVKKGELEKAVSVYNDMRIRNLVPSVACFSVFIDFLIKNGDSQLLLRIYMDMVELGVRVNGDEFGVLEKVVKLLCKDGKVQEVRNLVRKVIGSGIRPSDLVLDEIASGYCEKKDYDDLLKFFAEKKCVPSVLVSNKVIHSLCESFGAERASLFLQEMESIGFSTNEITYGIFIGWSCRERELKKAFIYFSECLSRSLKPHVRSYNALISGVFKEGMWPHAQDILYEMDDRGVSPNFETFKVLLAGYSKARQFDKVKELVCGMVGHGFIHVPSLEDPLSKAFELLGLDPSSVKLRRDNDPGLFKTEFFDKLGNGLYLETDITKFENIVNGVLADSLVPDFNSLILENCVKGNFKTSIIMLKKMVKWGQKLSFSAYTELVKGLCSSRLSMKTVVNLVGERPDFTCQLDPKTLNILVQALSETGFLGKATTIFEGMRKRRLDINFETYDALLTGLCMKRNLSSFLICMDFAMLDNWSPKPEDCKSIFSYLCDEELLNEALEVFGNVFSASPSKQLHISHDFLGTLCSKGFSSIAHVLVEELQNQGFVLDRICYSCLVEGFFKEKIRSKAFLVLELMVSKNLVPSLDATNLSISRYCLTNKFEKAINLKDIALREQPSSSISVFSSLISGICMSGKTEVGADIFRDLLLNDLHPDSEICNILVRGYCQDNNLRKVMEILSFMIRKNLGISIPMYRSFISFMCKSGKVPFALSMKELLLQQRNPDLSIYNILIFHLFRTKNNSHVEAVLSELHEKGVEFDAVTYNFLVYGYCCCDEVALSFKHLIAMLSTEYQPSNRSLRNVISCLCLTGEIEKALDLSRELELRGWVHDSITQNAIAEGLLSQNKLEKAVDFLDRMTKKALVPDSVNYDNVIKQLCRYNKEGKAIDNKEGKAIDLLNIMLKKANIPSFSTYDALIECSCKCLKLDQALDFLYEMLDMNLKPSTNTWNVIIHHVCQNGRTIEGERLLNLMVQIGVKPTRDIYCSLIDRYYYEKNLSKASEYMQKMQQNGHEPDFGTHWSLVSNLKNKSDENSGKGVRSFLSRLLLNSGFVPKKNFEAKPR